MESPGQHWLEKLFPPRFSSEDFFTQSHQPGPLICEELATERARRVAEIYNVAMIKSDGERGSQRKEPLSKLVLTELEPGLAGTNISKEGAEGDSAPCGAANLEAESEESIVGTESHCIWKPKEFVALRQEMHKEHLGSISLKLQLSFLKEELAGLRAKCKKLVAGFEEAKQELSLSRKETSCKDAQLQLLQKQSAHQDARIQALKQELLDQSTTIDRLKEELQQARGETLQLGLLHQDLQRELEELSQQQDLKAKLSAERATLRFDAERREMQRELEDAKKALGAEKALSTRNWKALEALKKHFAGPPSSDKDENLRVCFM